MSCVPGSAYMRNLPCTWGVPGISKATRGSRCLLTWTSRIFSRRCRRISFRMPSSNFNPIRIFSVTLLPGLIKIEPRMTLHMGQLVRISRPYSSQHCVPRRRSNVRFWQEVQSPSGNSLGFTTLSWTFESPTSLGVVLTLGSRELWRKERSVRFHITGLCPLIADIEELKFKNNTDKHGFGTVRDPHVNMLSDQGSRIGQLSG